MNRRDALKTSTLLVGGGWLLSSGVLAACQRAERGAPAATPDAVTPDDQALLAEIADTLLPTTASSPGAEAAGAGATMALLLNDCYTTEDRQRAVKGLADFRAACRQRRGAEFAALQREQREQFLRDVDAEAHAAGETHYFHLVRDLANTAYFSSEIGMTKALRYIQTPGRWVGCVPLQPGQPAWG